MKYSIILFLLLSACGTNRHSELSALLEEQKRLKDSTHTINYKIGLYISKGMHDSLDIQKKQLYAVYARLKRVQFSIDNYSGRR